MTQKQALAKMRKLYPDASVCADVTLWDYNTTGLDVPKYGLYAGVLKTPIASGSGATWKEAFENITPC